MFIKEDVILKMAFYFRHLSQRLKPSYIKSWCAFKKEDVKTSDDLFVVFNGPSVKVQNLLVMKDMDVMFVNRGFMHPLYKQMQPKYHVFVDTKMINGGWPVSWLDEVWKLSPKTKILLPLAWKSALCFENYRDNENIIWLTKESPYLNIGVSAACFSFGIEQKYKRIYFTGFEATGIAYEMIKSSDSHFYGNDEEWSGMTSEQYARALYMHSRHLHELNLFANKCKRKGVKIINLTIGGLLDMFERGDILGLNEKNA